MRLLALLAGILVLGHAGTARAAGWEKTRAEVIDPLNTALHRRFPSFVKAGDVESLVALYATETGGGLTWDSPDRVVPDAAETTLRWEHARGPEPIRFRVERRLALFDAVDKAELRIDRVAWREADAGGIPAEARLIVRGTRGDGTRGQLEERLAWRLAARDGQWRILGEDVLARQLVTGRSPRFVTVTDAAGVGNLHTNEGSPAYRLFGGSPDNPVRASGGSAVGDVDGDGCEDVVLAGSPDLVLLRNRCDGTFADVTAQAGLPHPYPAAATGVLFFDYDNDGWPDLFVAAVRGGDRLFRNVGGGRFTDVTAAAGIPAAPWSSMATVADYDRDGFLDLYLVRMGDQERTTPKPNFAATNGTGNLLLRNRGDGTFTDVTRHARVGHSGWDLAGAWADYDADGWPDLYVVNEFGGNALYHNERDGTFREHAAAAGVSDGGAAMGVAWGDYDGDGNLDLFVSCMHANSAWALFHPDFPAPIPWRFRLLGLFTDEVRRRSDGIITRLTRGSSLYRNNGDGTFTDVSDAAGVRDGQWGWAAEFLDYDDDGRLDLYATNGFITGPLKDDV